MAKRSSVDSNKSYALSPTTQPNPHIFDIAFGPDGDLYLADAGNSHAIRRLSPEMDERAAWSLPLYDSSMGGGPFGIGVDQLGRVYCADGRHNCIHVLSSSGEPLARWDGFRWPMGVAVDLAGQVFVADSDADRVVVLSPDGQKLNTWGVSGRAPGRFRTPMALDVGIDGHVYVLDQGNNRVQVFQTNGLFISAWRIAARGHDRLGNSRGIAVLDDGSVLLTNFFSNRLYRCSSDGSLIGWVGGRPHEPHIVNMPCGIAIAADGIVYVADGALKAFSPSFELLATWP